MVKPLPRASQPDVSPRRWWIVGGLGVAAVWTLLMAAVLTTQMRDVWSAPARTPAEAQLARRVTWHSGRIAWFVTAVITEVGLVWAAWRTARGRGWRSWFPVWNLVLVAVLVTVATLTWRDLDY